MKNKRDGPCTLSGACWIVWRPDRREGDPQDNEPAFIRRHWRPRFLNRFPSNNRKPSRRRSPSNSCFFCGWNVRHRQALSDVTDTKAGELSFPATAPSFKPFPDSWNLLLMSPHIDITLLSINPGHVIARAVGRSESTLAFTIGLLRRIGNFPNVGHRLTADSFAGRTSGIARFYQILSSRTLGPQWRSIHLTR
jgi:hypothetical protein